MTKKTIDFSEEKQGKHYVVDYRNVEPMSDEIAGGNVRSENGYGDIQGDIVDIMLDRHNSGEKHLIFLPIKGFRKIGDPGKWVSLEGHRRIRACSMFHEQTGIAPMVQIITENVSNKTKADLITEMALSSTAKPLTPVEWAGVVSRLENEGLSQKEIAAKLGKKDLGFVRNLSRLSKSPKRIRDLIESNTISYSTVISIFQKEPDFEKALSTIEKALDVAKTKTPREQSSEPRVKISRSDLNEATNLVDSHIELRRVLLSSIEIPTAEKIFSAEEVREFCMKIIENKITKTEITQFLFL